MSLKSRIQQNRISKMIPETNIELLDFFNENKDIDVLYVYSPNKIYEEKNGVMQKSSFAYSSYTFYAEEIEKITELYGCILTESSPEATIDISNSVTLEVLVPPAVSDGIYTVIRRKNRNGSSPSKLIISDEINSYLKECLNQKINIFVTGDAYTDKAAVLKLLADMINISSKIIISDKKKEIKFNQPCSVRINNVYENIKKIPFDNVFINDADTNDLIKIFRLIIGGYKGFVVSLSLNDKADILSSVRNMILIDSPNLFDENADFMSFSSMDVIVKTEKTEDGNIVISKISEIFKNINGYFSDDIFVLDKSGTHISTGLKSKFSDKIKQNFPSSYFEKNHVHSYSENNTISITDNTEITPVNDYVDSDYQTDLNEKNNEPVNQEESEDVSPVLHVSGLDKLKNKLKKNKNKTENEINAEELTTEEEITSDFTETEQTESETEEENTVIFTETEQTEQETEEEQETDSSVIREEDEDASPDEAVEFTESDDFQTEDNEEQQQQKSEIVNILKDYDENTEEQEDDIVEEDVQFVEEEDEEEKTVAEPELFSEISEIDVDSMPDEIFETEDDDI